MEECTTIAVDFDTRMVDRNGKSIWDTRLFGPDEEQLARAFLRDKQRTVLAALSKRMVRIDGRVSRIEWRVDGGLIACESEIYD